MVKFSGGKAAATLLLAAAILAPPTTMGYMDFEVNKLKLRHPVSIEKTRTDTILNNASRKVIL